MTTGDVPDLINRYFDGDLSGGTELSRATRGVVIPQTATLYIRGTARFAQFPAYPTIMALTDALGLGHDDEVLRAFALSGKQLRMRPRREEWAPEPELIQALRKRHRLHALDDHPRLVQNVVRMIGSTADALLELQQSQLATTGHAAAPGTGDQDHPSETDAQANG